MKDRIRKPGAGRKTLASISPETIEQLDQLVDQGTAGCPVKGDKWTYLTSCELSVKLAKEGYRISDKSVAKHLRERRMGRRSMSKTQTMKEDIEGRDEQFKTINSHRENYLAKGWLVLCIDVKKKETLGRFYRKGKVWVGGKMQCFDHDFASFSQGKVVPHGIYDVSRNEGYITLGSGADTAEFNVACIKKYWQEVGAFNHQLGNPILILADGGGSNGRANRMFKQEIQDWADEYGLNVRIAHYPPYCSKYNPIEHRLFPSITRAWSGVMLDCKQTMVDLIKERLAEVKSGLKVNVGILEQKFKKGIKVFDNYLEYCNIIPDSNNPKWNYRILAMNQTGH